MLLGHVQRAVNGDYHNFYSFLDVLERIEEQKYIASCLREELARVCSSKTIAENTQNSAEESGCTYIYDVPNKLIQELADVRFSFAKLKYKYKREVQKSTEAQDNFVEFLPQLCTDSKFNGGSFESLFDKLVQEEISLFNVYYLKRSSEIFPQNICTATTQLVEAYEQQLQDFMTSTTLVQFKNQFKHLFPTSEAHPRLSNGKVPIILKLNSDWGKNTIADLERLVKKFGVLGSHLHLSKVESGCVEVTWLCKTSVAEDISVMLLSEIRTSFWTMGVIKILLFRRELSLSAQGSKTMQEIHSKGTYVTKSNEEVPFTDKVEGRFVGAAGGTAGALGGIGGAGIGAVIGGIIGSIAPGPGTALGLVIGAAIGGGIGAAAGAGAGARAVYQDNLAKARIRKSNTKT